MSELELRIEVGKAEVKDLFNELDVLKQDIVRAEDALKTMEAHKKELIGEWRQTGTINAAKGRLAKAELELKDSTARIVVWKERRNWSHDDNSDYVVVKVTSKRVYVRQKNVDGREVYYNRLTGQGTNKYEGQIDVAATFPEGVNNYE